MTRPTRTRRGGPDTPATAPRQPTATDTTRPAPPAPEASVQAAQIEEHLRAAALLINTFHLRHMMRVYAAFDGDLVEAVVLGEVAHHNFSAFRSAAANALELSALLKRRDKPGAPPLLPTNAYSIATATGIPRETVRRKIDSLVRKRLLRRDRSGALFVTPRAREHFAAFSVESVAEFVSTHRQIESLLQPGVGADATPRHTGHATAPEP